MQPDCFVMSKALIRAVRRYAHGAKGLDQETYRLHLSAVGARHTNELTRHQHQALMERLRSLPDRPRPASRGGRGA
jgi:hypothetical protein